MLIPRRIAIAVVAASVCGWALVAPTPSGAEPEPGNLGTNLAGITYYDGATIFADIVKQAGEWVPQRQGGSWGSGAPLQLRADGWPQHLGDSQFASTVLAETHYPAGRYAVSWRGSGAFDINGHRFSGSGGSGYVDLDGTSIVVLNLRRTEVDDPVREIAVRAPGVPADALFHPDYVAQLAPYAVLRFMDWQRTNSTLGDSQRVFRCAERVTTKHYSQGTSAGAAVETMVALANATDRDPWFTIPHEAGDDWVRCHASVVATTLAPHLVPRYEFSNETWNPGFRAFHDLTDEARRAGLGNGDGFLGLQQKVGQRHNAVMDVVGAEMRAVGRPFVRVLAGQAANAWVLEQRLATPGTADRTDEIAIAPYLGIGGNPFDVNEAATLARLDAAAVVARLTANQAADVDRWMLAHVELAREVGARLVAYEGGQHLAGDPGNQDLTRLFTTVNRSAAMGQLYDTYLQRWRAATGNALLVHFSDVGPYTRFGSWGALETPAQAPAASPKYQALLRFSGAERTDPQPPSAIPVEPVAPGVPGAPESGARPAQTARMSIVGGRFTRSRSVVLSVRWPDDAVRARVADRPDLAGARTQPRGTAVRWTLPRPAHGVGRHRLFLTFVGSSDTHTHTYSDDVVLDRVRPDLKGVAARRGPGPITRISSRARDRGSGVKSIQVSARPRGRPIATVAYARKVRIPRVGSPPWSVRAIDRAGNTGRWATVRPS